MGVFPAFAMISVVLAVQGNDVDLPARWDRLEKGVRDGILDSAFSP